MGKVVQRLFQGHALTVEVTFFDAERERRFRLCNLHAWRLRA